MVNETLNTALSADSDDFFAKVDMRPTRGPRKDLARDLAETALANMSCDDIEDLINSESIDLVK